VEALDMCFFSEAQFPNVLSEDNGSSSSYNYSGQ
jgi:hypothetical protein